MEKTLLTYQDLIEDSSIPFNSLNTIKAHIRRGDFPAPIEYGPRLKRWHKDTIEKWKAAHIPAIAA